MVPWIPIRLRRSDVTVVEFATQVTPIQEQGSDAGLLFVQRHSGSTDPILVAAANAQRASDVLLSRSEKTINNQTNN